MKHIEIKTPDDCLTMAQQFEIVEQFDMALKYYCKAEEMNPGNKTAEMGIIRAKTELSKTVFFRSPANYKLVEGRLELRRGLLVFMSATDDDEYLICYLENPRVKFGRLVFDYKGQPIEGYSCSVARKWAQTLMRAKEGKYPAISGIGLSSIEKYIHENFTEETREDAVTYFMELTSCDSTDARIVVQRILG